jgi:hypothetical protein
VRRAAREPCRKPTSERTSAPYLQGRNTLPHFFFGAASVPGFDLLAAADVAALGLGVVAATCAAPVTEALGVALLATAFGAVGPGVTVGALTAGVVDETFGKAALAGGEEGTSAGELGAEVAVAEGGAGTVTGAGAGGGAGRGADEAERDAAVAEGCSADAPSAAA